ncbi:MAG TPA: NUDIX hydrolase [Gammaproteobacteria bacterium]
MEHGRNARQAELMQPRIDVTVAAVIERDGQFLIVEELACGRVVFNQPAGHLEPGESLIDAVVRETREETGYRFEPRHVLGIYLWRSETSEKSFLRVSFLGAAEPPSGSPRLDEGILAVHWMSRNRLLGLREQLRSPLVLRCIDDYRAGVRFPLDCLTHVDLGPQGRARLA